MLFNSAIMTRGSGSIGGVTVARNAGGMYMRARVTPVNPSTPFQNDVRAAAAELTNRWANVLTQVQRDAWNLYAFNTPLVGPLGEPRTVSGIAMYVRGNVQRSIEGAPLADAAPLAFDLGSFTPTTGDVWDVSLQNLNLQFTASDPWANEDDSHMFVFISRPQNASVNYFTGPYRFAGSIDGDAITPPTTPALIPFPFVYSQGQKGFARLVVSRVDGRYSNDQKHTGLASPV